MRARLLGLALAGVLFATGCGSNDDDDPPPSPPSTPSSATGATGGGSSSRSTSTKPIPPSLAPLSIPAWPPFGPTSRLEARCSDDVGVSYVTAFFKYSTTAYTGSASFSGADLGEGQGDLRVVCCDVQHACAERDVDDFLVDLSPPEIEPERLVASPLADGFAGEISLWVGDAWVLGSVELQFAGVTLKNELPKAYPSTVGKAWDVSRVVFHAKDLPVGSGKATVTAHDAAGNVTVRDFDLRLDATPPTVSILAPAPDAVVAGTTIPVKLQAADPDNATPARIDLWVGGAHVAELEGPLTELDVDTSTLPSGPTEIRAVARDDAGNESVAAKVVVQVP